MAEALNRRPLQKGSYHDLHADGTAYRPDELDAIRKWASGPGKGESD